MTRTATYRAWSHMRERCEDPTNPRYRHYGGRGIFVCERWQRFEAFFSDMGVRPAGRSIDRIDNNGGYTCGRCDECQRRAATFNCRWATSGEQSRNTTRNRYLTWKGETLLISDWADRLRINRSTLIKRLARGWSVEEALAGQRRIA